MTHAGPLPVAIVGAGHRSRTVYAPLLTGPLTDRFSLVGVVGRTDFRAPALAREHGVPWSLDLEDAVGWGARGLILCVNAHLNGEVALRAAELGLPLLLETPVGWDLPQARAVRDATAHLPVEVAEQNPRFPEVQLWRAIVAAGELGRVQAVCSDAAGYRYHAAAVARALLGRPAARHATGARTIFADDFGRGCGPEPLVTGAVTTEGGALYQVRDGEPLHLGAWQRGGWWIAGDRGSLRADALHRRGGDSEPVRVERVSGVATRWACGDHAVDALLPGQDEDRLAVARCLLDWQARIEGVTTPTQWSVQDGLADLAWTIAVERAAALGARVEVAQLLGGR